MGYRQITTPTPDIPCRPGWCLQYVRETFGHPGIHPTATAAWEASATKHRDRNFPAGVWIPVWYGLDTNEAGHVVLRAPDGSVYSTSDLTNTPHHHPDLADLEAYYAYYGMTLTYRGWTEDVQGIPVIKSITPQSTEEFTVAEAAKIIAILTENQARITRAVAIATENQRRISATREIVQQIAAKTGVAIDYDKVEAAAKAGAADALADGVEVAVTVNGG